MRAGMLMVAMMTAMLGATVQGQEPTTRDDVVVATGEGVVKRAPDRAFVVITAESRARQPQAAQEANARTMTAVQARLAEMGFRGELVRTLSVGLQPEYDWADGRQTLRGYVARNAIEVRIDDMTRVGGVIDAAVAAGATQVTNVQFTLRDMGAAEREALTLASRDALARARAMAEGVGREVAKVLRLDESRANEPVPVMMRMDARQMAAEAAPPTPVAAGDIEVRSQVRLTAVLK